MAAGVQGGTEMENFEENFSSGRYQFEHRGN